MENEYEINDSYERLEILRGITKLGPIANAKVLKARKEAEKFRDLYVQYERNDAIGVDYTVANYLETSLREQALERAVEKDWVMYGNGTSLGEYVDGIIEDRMMMQQHRSGR